MGVGFFKSNYTFGCMSNCKKPLAGESESKLDFSLGLGGLEVDGFQASNTLQDQSSRWF